MKKVIKRNVWQWKLMEYISYLIIFITPLYFSKNHYYIFSSPKIILFTALTLIMLIIFLLGNWNKDQRIRFNLVNLFLILLLVILTISSIFGVDSYNSFLGWTQTVPLVTIYVLAIFSFLVSFLINKNKKFLVNILKTSVFTSILVLIAYYIKLVPQSFEGSTLGNSSYLGEYLFFNALFAFGLFLFVKNKWGKVLFLIGTVFLVFSPIFVNKNILNGSLSIIDTIKNPIQFLGISNAGTLGLIVSALFVITFFLIKSKKNYIKYTGYLLIILSLATFYYLGNQLTNPESSLHKAYIVEKTGNRFLSWDIAKQGFIHNPILGVGFNNYIYNFEKHFSTDLFKDGYLPEKFYQPHNIFWEFASNTGLLGLISFLLLLGIIIVSFLRNEENKKIKLVLASIIVGYFVQNLFGFDTIVTYMILFMVIGIAMSYDNSLQWGVNINRSTNKIFSVIFGLVSISMIYYFVILPNKESKAFYLKIPVGNVQEISLIGGVVDTTYFSNKIFEKYKSSLDQVTELNKAKYLKDIEGLVNQLERNIEKQFELADSYLVAGKLMNLHMLTNMKKGNTVSFNGTNYNQDDWEKAYAYLTKSKELNPNNVQSYLTLSQLYLIKGDIKMARVYSEQAIIIAPENKEVYNFARGIVKISLDKEFADFINEMEKNWIKN